jgi:hypothetical protein
MLKLRRLPKKGSDPEQLAIEAREPLDPAEYAERLNRFNDEYEIETFDAGTMYQNTLADLLNSPKKLTKEAQEDGFWNAFNTLESSVHGLQTRHDEAFFGTIRQQSEALLASGVLEDEKDNLAHLAARISHPGRIIDYTDITPESDYIKNLSVEARQYLDNAVVAGYYSVLGTRDESLWLEWCCALASTPAVVAGLKASTDKYVLNSILPPNSKKERRNTFYLRDSKASSPEILRTLSFLGDGEVLQNTKYVMAHPSSSRFGDPFAATWSSLYEASSAEAGIMFAHIVGFTDQMPRGFDKDYLKQARSRFEYTPPQPSEETHRKVGAETLKHAKKEAHPEAARFLATHREEYEQSPWVANATSNDIQIVMDSVRAIREELQNAGVTDRVIQDGRIYRRFRMDVEKPEPTEDEKKKYGILWQLMHEDTKGTIPF